MAQRKKYRGRIHKIAADENYCVKCCEDGHIHIDIRRPGTKTVRLVADPEEAYEFAQAILRSYDEAVGIFGP